jgi:formylglycine-generating enzyme required for sulfatase activity
MPLLLSHAAFANGSCELSNWYVSKNTNVTKWIGDYDKASQIPGDWDYVTDWQLNRTRQFKNMKHDLYAIAQLTTDSDYTQGLSVPEGFVEIRLNGTIVERYRDSGVIYALDLQKGNNTVEIRVIYREKFPHERVHMSLCELEYIYPQLPKIIEDTRLAIRHLGEQHPSYNSKRLLKQLAKLENSGASEEEFKKFRYQALVIDNPVIDFEQILFRRSGSSRMPANWRGNSQFLHRARKTTSPNFDDSLELLDLKTGQSKVVYDPANPKEGLMDICLDYTGDKFLYSGVDTETTTFQIYEMNIDGSGKRQITSYLPEIDHYNGIYLPNGKILFCSTIPLNSVPCVGGQDYVGTLFEMEYDGSNLRQVTFDQENNWYPWVKENGKVMYHRWEYTDNSHYFTRILMEMNPDGSNNRSIYGSNSYWPNTLFYAKQIPGNTSQFSAVVSGHHGIARAGELWLFDHNISGFETEGARKRIPGRGKKIEPKIIDKYVSGKWPLFLHPYPLDEIFFLVSAQQTPSSKWELFLVDTFDNMIKLGTSSKHMFEPVPLKPRKRPPIIPDRRNPNADQATLYIQDIYEGPGLAGVPRGEVDAIRIFTYGYAYRDTGSHDALAIEGGWDTKRVLGTVPVEEDGSVMVNIPHNMPLSLQPLDKDGRAMQVMRSWLTAQPGERLACIGCHESSNTAPIPRSTLASRMAPKKLTPWSKVGKPYNYGFKREIQPILDRYCVGCHDGSQGSLNFKDTTEQNFGKARFSTSYLALHPYVRRPGPESDLHVLTPLDYHASSSELFQMLGKGHHGVEVDGESMRELATWVDLNVPYTATWTDYRNDERTRELAARTVEFKAKYAGIDDDIEWLPPMLERPDFIEPEKEPARPAPLQLKGWPLGDTSPPVTRTISFGAEELTFVRIPAGRFVMGSVEGANDEFPQAIAEIQKPFWMSITEISNNQFRQFNPKHDSKVIDQQWKDHIFAGYPANEPQMPAIRVSWSEAMEFCNWLSTETGLKATLPTEAQWEWAARAGSDQPFHFGNLEFEDHANLADDNIGLLAVVGVDPKPLPVERRTPLTDFVPRDTSFDDGRLLPDGTMQYKPNAWGLYDMHGNVSEWTRSGYTSYPYKADDGRNDLSEPERKAVRGGSWRDRPERATASFRLGYQSYQKVFNVGFRVIIEE